MIQWNINRHSWSKNNNNKKKQSIQKLQYIDFLCWVSQKTTNIYCVFLFCIVFLIPIFQVQVTFRRSRVEHSDICVYFWFFARETIKNLKFKIQVNFLCVFVCLHFFPLIIRFNLTFSYFHKHIYIYKYITCMREPTASTMNAAVHNLSLWTNNKMFLTCQITTRRFTMLLSYKHKILKLIPQNRRN